jgi:MinD superfamily P-loop ATPase
MKQLVILSGKGGTGKTSITAALAHLAAQEYTLVMADADVDAANLELVLDPTKEAEFDFHAGMLAIIDPEACTECGVCESVCRFDAVRSSPYEIDPIACEGCAACFYQCPSGAISMEEQHAGVWYRSSTRFGPLLHAHLFAGQENSGKLVTRVKHQAYEAALEMDADLLFVDGPPGIGCPVISAITASDLTLLVVEPTVSGAHDLDRILATAEHFGVPAAVAINKADLNPARSEDIEAFCRERGVPVAGRIPYDNAVTEAMVAGQPVTAFDDGPVTQAVRDLWARMREELLS